MKIQFSAELSAGTKRHLPLLIMAVFILPVAAYYLLWTMAYTMTKLAFMLSIPYIILFTKLTGDAFRASVEKSGTSLSSNLVWVYYLLGFACILLMLAVFVVINAESGPFNAYNVFGVGSWAIAVLTNSFYCWYELDWDKKLFKSQ